MRETSVRFLPLVLLAVFQLAKADGAIEARDAWVRGVPPGQETTAAYMTVLNGSTALRSVLGVSSPEARAVEIHESRQVDGMWQMRRLEQLTLPAGGRFSLQPGAAHLMVFGLAKTPQPGDKLHFELRLDDGETLLVEAEVRAPGSAH
jgi:copper(I)-binding protein